MSLLFRVFVILLFATPRISLASFTTRTYTFSTTSSATDSVGESVSAHATFRITADSVVVTLVNEQKDVVSVGQNISSLYFTVNNCGSIFSLGGSSGNLVSIGSGGKIDSSSESNSLDHWHSGQSSGQFYLNDLAGGGSPDQTIIGPQNGEGDYSTVNHSIYDNAPHNPFVQNEATFTYKFPPGELTDSTKISKVTIGFGTQAGCNQTTYLSSSRIPTPGSLPLFLIGLIALLGRALRKRKSYSGSNSEKSRNILSASSGSSLQMA